MNNGKVENGLALLGVLIVLLGVSFAASTALADDVDSLTPTLISESPTTD